MGNDYGVLVATGDGSDKIFSVLPESQVFAVTLISIDSDVTFSRVSIHKDDLQNRLSTGLYQEIRKKINTATSWLRAAFAAPSTS